MNGQHYRDDVEREFRRLKSLAEKALAQVTDEDFFRLPGEEENSIAVIVKHMAGNLRSRWTDFLTSDGEKPDRNRDGEFVIERDDTRTSLMERWENGWRALFTSIVPLTEHDLEAKVRIRGEEHSVVQAIQRQVSHYAYHVGQIVLLARHFAGHRWRTLSVARGKSASYNARPEPYLGGTGGARGAGPAPRAGDSGGAGVTRGPGTMGNTAP